MHYFDYAATTPLCDEGKEAMLQQLSQGWHNPSAQYQEGLERQKEIGQYRNILAKALSCDPSEFFFTSGGTESNNWAIAKGAYHGRHQGKHCISSTVEHSSVRKSMKSLEEQGYTVTYLTPDKTGQITQDMVLSALQEDTIFLSLMMVNNESGFISDIQGISKAVKEKNPHCIIHCDAIQGFLKIPFSMSAVEEQQGLPNVDLLSISGHKVYAPKGTGGLFIRKGLALTPLFHGGGQEQGLRSGTEPTHQYAAFAAAVDCYSAQFSAHLSHISEIKQQTMERLTQNPKIKLHVYDGIPTSPNILACSLVGYPSQVVLRYLSERGVALSAGSACHKGGESHVFATLPLSKQERISALRISFSHLTTEEDINALITGLEQARETLIPSF